jgi:hypothetical protein
VNRQSLLLRGLRSPLLSIRVRLTLWYMAILFAILVVFALVIYFGLGRALRSETDVRQ